MISAYGKDASGSDNTPAAKEIAYPAEGASAVWLGRASI